MERIILTTGGTGGHIFPALAVGEELRQRWPAAMILFMGGAHGPEGDLAVKAGFDFVGLPVRGVVGRGWRGALAGCAMLRGMARARAVMRAFKPQVVAGFGGYAAFAGVAAAQLSGRPTAIHEQNGVPGLTNKLLAKKAGAIFVSMPDAVGAFPAARTRLTGNPVRASIAAMATSSHAERRTGRPARLLVMGGSLGARAVNRGVLAALSRLLEAGVEIWHQTGQADYETSRAAYRAARADHVRVEPFIEDMAKAYAWADLALCRAGGSSVAELGCAGLPSVLVPYPFAARDHQLHNARHLEGRGGAVVLAQEAFYPDRAEVLADTLLGLLSDSGRLAAMADGARSAAVPDAAARIVDGLVSLTGEPAQGAADF